MYRSVLFLIALALLHSSAACQNLRAVNDSLQNHPAPLAYKINLKDDSVNLVDAVIYFKKGTLYLSEQLPQFAASGFFIGAGKLIYRSQDKIEIQQIKRFYGDDTAVVSFDQIYFAFPGESNVLERFRATAERQPPPYRVSQQFYYLRNIPSQVFNFNLPLLIYKAAVEGRSYYLWIDAMQSNKHTIYTYNPYDREQVSLYLYSPRFASPQLVSSAEDKSVGGPFRREYDLYHYDMNVDISTYAKSSIACGMSMIIESDSIKILRFAFPAGYDIDSVGGKVQDSPAFIKEKDRSGLTIELPRYYHRGDSVDIRVVYRTNLFYHAMNYGVVQQNLTTWYPQSEYRHLSRFDIKYRIDNGFGFMSVGEKILDSVAAGKHLYEFRTPEPVTYLSFNYGIFDTLEANQTEIPVTIYSLSAAHNSIFGNSNIKRVGEDVVGSMKFFSENFCPYPFGKLDVDDMAITYGQGSPGVIHLSEKTFNRSLYGIDDLFRAHEVAHQWWGHLVIPETYHDVWISEGLAEYSAMLYIQLVKGEEKQFRELMQEWRKAIVTSGATVKGNSVGFRAGPIILGNRLRTELSPADYEILLYYKAAYVMHMLRYELEGSGTARGKFLSLLSKFAHSNAHKLTTTEDFIAIAREFLGDRTDQFFAQWIYGWKVPVIDKKKKIEKDGTAAINLIVGEVDNNFATPYPVRFKLSDGSFRTVIYTLKFGDNHFELHPEDGLSVKDVDFNPDYDILER